MAGFYLLGKKYSLFLIDLQDMIYLLMTELEINSFLRLLQKPKFDLYYALDLMREQKHKYGKETQNCLQQLYLLFAEYYL
jgi:hypothetical protein